MALPFREPRRRSNFLHHTLNITVEPKHLEEALSCLVESILGIRSRGKLVCEYPRGFREKPKSSNLKNCTSFNFDYYSIQSKELGQRIGRQIRRFRWLSCVFRKASVAEVLLEFLSMRNSTWVDCWLCLFHWSYLWSMANQYINSPLGGREGIEAASGTNDYNTERVFRLHSATQILEFIWCQRIFGIIQNLWYELYWYFTLSLFCWYKIPNVHYMKCNCSFM